MFADIKNDLNYLKSYRLLALTAVIDVIKNSTDSKDIQVRQMAIGEVKEVLESLSNKWPMGV